MRSNRLALETSDRSRKSTAVASTAPAVASTSARLAADHASAAPPVSAANTSANGRAGSMAIRTGCDAISAPSAGPSPSACTRR